MSADSPFTLFTARLDAAGIEYMVTGGVASAIYGEPRPTDDIDVVIAIDRAAIPGFVTAFPRSEFRYEPTEVIAIECERDSRGSFVLLHGVSELRADLWLVGRDALHAWGMARRTTVSVGTVSVHLAPIEYVIVRKLERYREGRSTKHLEDIRGMLRSSPDAIDAAELGRMIASLGLAPEWAEVASAWRENDV